MSRQICQFSPSPPGFRRGVTLVETMISVLVLSLVMASLMALVSGVGRVHKGIFFQQRILKEAKRALEGAHGVNSEIRLARAPLTLVDPDGNGWSNQIRFRRAGETTIREFRLVGGPDGDLATPHDNRLIFDPDVATANNEIVVSKMIMPDDLSLGAFSYTSALTPLVFRARVGDARGDEAVAETAQGVQGAEINVTVAPRNN